jgi:hypothetical protein
MKTLPSKDKEAINNEVKMMLLAHLDKLINQNHIPAERSQIIFDPRCGYVGEAFGIMRGLVSLRYGYYGVNSGGEESMYNVKWWYDQMIEELRSSLLADIARLSPEKPYEYKFNEAVQALRDHYRRLCGNHQKRTYRSRKNKSL